MAGRGTYEALACLAPTHAVGSWNTPEAFDRAAFEDLLDFCDSRADCADFRMIAALRLTYVHAAGFPAGLTERLHRTLLRFPYWLGAEGGDRICHWSENHQVLFSACELLAGHLLAAERFADGRTGAEHAARAQARLERWLRLRFSYGFSEWLSPVYYVEDVAALVVLVDHAPDPTVVARATLVLDLLLLDLALHRFDGHVLASAGRCYEQQKKHPDLADVQPLADLAFDPARAADPDWNSLAMLFATRTTYAVPAVLAEIAHDTGPTEIRLAAGLTVAEAMEMYADPRDPETTAALLWSMETFVHPLAIRTTMAAFDHWHLRDNAFLLGLRALQRVPSVLLPTAVRALDPPVQGTALERADVVTCRTPAYLLSSAQRYRPGDFGDQQHIWQLLLPGAISVFGTHPGAALAGDSAREQTPDEWVGNGISPTVVQAGGTLLALYDTRGRRGFGEGRRAERSHLYVPFERFDEVRQGDRRLLLRAGRALVAVIGTQVLHRGADEVTQHGAVTGWAVVCSDLDEHGSLTSYGDWLASSRLETSATGLRIVTPDRTLVLDTRQPATPHPRYDAPWVQAERACDQIVVTGRSGRLVLDWQTGRALDDRPTAG